ncbi:cupin domain-containing protein [Arthrobacter sp. SAFR-044]|uniref:cupin domain-containing protein n=1 Tax=Arthrobacter sp. SAFR-044 TaxID=3387278 RepID=UPI003F7BA25A
MSTVPAFTTASFLDPGKNEPFELGHVQWVRRFGEGDRPALACGYWHVTPTEAPEPFDLVMEADETIHILDGHLRIEVEDGDTYDLTAGGAASFNKGARTRWAVLAPTVEFFVYS